MNLKGEYRTHPASGVLLPNSDSVVKEIYALVEKHIIKSHVEVAVVVDPLILYDFLRADY